MGYFKRDESSEAVPSQVIGAGGLNLPQLLQESFRCFFNGDNSSKTRCKW